MFCARTLDPDAWISIKCKRNLLNCFPVYLLAKDSGARFSTQERVVATLPALFGSCIRPLRTLVSFFASFVRLIFILCVLGPALFRTIPGSFRCKSERNKAASGVSSCAWESSKYHGRLQYRGTSFFKTPWGKCQLAYAGFERSSITFARTAG